jgi:hypothetical protein
MSKRLAVVVVAILAATAACSQKGGSERTSQTRPTAAASAPAPASTTSLPPPQTSSPQPQSTAAAPLPPSATPPATTMTNVPANRWSAVLIAGDNNSPAFDNGVESMREKLAQRGVQQIKVLSSNPARAPAGNLASSGNVRTALRGLAGGQACLAFITTHGEVKGAFLRPDRRFLDPAALDSALQAGCGNAPTVVIVSACHSGTFMTPEMRKPNRVILTAAAKDRTSFGCGAKDLYTYYDQCLLQVMDQAQTWADVAASTRSCVENLERTLAVRASSEPQVFLGQSVGTLRLPGR